MPHKPGFIHTGKDENSWNYFELPFGSGADYKEPIPLENLPYTPAVLGEMLDNKEKEREIEIEGLGKGKLVISKQNKNKPFFYPNQSEEYIAKKSRQLQIGEIVGNLPIITSPVTTLSKGVPKIIQSKTKQKIDLAAMKAKETKNLNKNAINLEKSLDNVFNMPMQQSSSYYKRAANVAKKNHISLTDAFKYLDSIQKGIRPDKPIKPGNISGITNKGLLKDTDKDDPTVYIPPEERPDNEFKAVLPNYKPIQGPDEDSALLPWASTRANISHYDVSNHRIFEVPGMKDEAQAKRYKNWITTQLIKRYQKQQIDPTLNIKRWSSVHDDFIDSQGNGWRLVRADKKNGVGADQEFIPTPLLDIDSRLMKKQNTNMEEKVILNQLLRTEVRARNAFEKKYPWLRDWISEQTGENYHEHMFGLDETEFWNSAYGKSLGYMNNDVYNIEKGLGNIVFLQDPRFKKMKDAVADYITPGKKREVFPGFKVRAGKVKVFTEGPYKGLNAIIGYDANPKSRTYTDLTIYAYNPSSTVNFGVRVATMPNYYSIVFARDSNGRRILSDESAQLFVNQYLDAVLKGDQPKIVALTDLASVLAKQYPYLVKPGGDFELPAPSGLNLDIDYRTAGAYSVKAPDPDPLDLKTFKMDPALQRKFDKNWKKMLLRIKKGRYEQKDFLELLFPEGDGID
tara:strand:+ start:65 stop:2110 length:2046 start_codon:yes stop_codon:yes gene_type:complete